MSKNIFNKTSLSDTNLVLTLKDRSSVVNGIRADENGFNLGDVTRRLDLKPKDLILINWHQFDDIDEVRFTDLARFFLDIWYPAADHIDIFDETFQWVISIGYSGEVLAVQFE